MKKAYTLRTCTQTRKDFLSLVIFFSAAFLMSHIRQKPHANLRVFTRVYDVKGAGGGAIFSLNGIFSYNTWGRVDPTLTVYIPDYGSCIYSSELF